MDLAPDSESVAVELGLNQPLTVMNGGFKISELFILI